MSQLPEGWVTAELGDLYPEFQNGASSRGESGGEPTVVLRLADVIDGKVSLDRPRSLSLGEVARSKYRANRGDVLVIRVNGSTDLVGRFILCDADDLVYCDHFIRMHVDDRVASARFLTWLGASHLVRAQIERAFVSTAGQKTVNQEHVRSISFPLAPRTEQDRIVAAIEEQFSRIDAGVAALERVRKNLKRLRAAALQAGIMGRHDRGEQGSSRLPASWKWVPLEGVLAEGKASFRRGPFGSALTKASFVEKGYKVYEQYCPINDDCSFGRYYVTAERYAELQGFAVEAGDFLVSCSGSLGRITQVPRDYEKGVINQALLRIRTDKHIVLDEYFLALFRSPYFQQQMLANSTGTAMVNVKGVKDLKAIPVPLPPLAEQVEILDRLRDAEFFAERLDQSLVKLERRTSSLRTSILGAAFSGRLVSPNSDDEPAALLLERLATERASSNDHKPTLTRNSRSPRTRVTA